MTYAYTGDVLLPVTVTPAADGSTSVKAHANWLVCHEICVPEEGDFRLDLPAGAAAPSAQAPLFAAFDRQVPPPSPWQAVVGRDGTLFVQGAELTPATVVDAWFIPDAPGHDPRQCRAAADRPGRWVHPRAAAGQGVPARRTGCRASCRSVTGAGCRPTCVARCRRHGAAAAAGDEPAAHARAGIPGRADPQPDAVRVPGAGVEGCRSGRRCARQGTLAGRRLHGRRAGGVRRPLRGAAGGARRGHGGRLGIPVPVAGVRRRDGLAAVRGGAQSVRVSTSSAAA